MDRVRRRIADKRVLLLIKAFLKAGILGKDGQIWGGDTGTPQGGILSPLLANVALSVLNEHFDQHTISTVERAKRRRHGLANYRLIRYADDFVIMCPETGHKPKRCSRRWRRCSVRWGFACRPRRR
jgi:RNA-directed DNA polymerase